MVAKGYKQINPQMVTLARESRGYTQPELANKLGVNQGWLSRVEGGLRTVTPQLLDGLATSLNYPPEFFTLSDKVYGLGMSSYFHRKKQRLSNRKLRRIHALIYIHTMHIARLLRGLETGENNIKPINIDDFGGNAGEIARIIRVSWKIPHGPIPDVVSVIEDAGGIIIPFDFGTDEIDAVYHSTPETPALFFTNLYSPSDRLRFTLCHELGHALIHSETFDPELIEKQANEFAAEFLMPQKDIMDYLTDLTLERLMILKQYWKVSMSALLKRASDIKAITPAQSLYLWQKMSKAGFRKHEPLELNLPVETPSVLAQMVKVYFEDLDYSIPEFAHLLALNTDEVKQYYIGSEQYRKAKENRDAIKEAERILKQSN
jgi:Zn-dependent peptidase ImmA (M78 family)/transcriptional regulator with XRE-family HTH domain